jgi:hypothetical protein
LQKANGRSLLQTGILSEEWDTRSGLSVEPAVAAASAVMGRIAVPDEVFNMDKI